MSASVQQLSIGGAAAGSIVFVSNNSPQQINTFYFDVVASISPSGNAAGVQWVLATQNTTLPTTGFVTVSFVAAPLVEVLAGPPTTPGTYYVWLRDPVSGAYGVSPALVATP